MQLTDQQHQIIESTGNIRINAVAGSGKSTTLRHYVKARPEARFLYLAFNKTVKDEARLRFKQMGIQNVRVETAHSLAYQQTVLANKWVLQHTTLKPFQLATLLGLSNPFQLETLTLARHIDRLMRYFCNSVAPEIDDIDYPEMLDQRARSFVNQRLHLLYQKTNHYWSLMLSGQLPITHDAYLKAFQLSQPDLNRYTHILFDEAQDACPAMLSIFLNQRGHKIMVGDTHQQIYSWRQAVNSMQAVDFPTLHLSQSFRFGPPIAGLAQRVLLYKSYLDSSFIVPQIEGIGGKTPSSTFAILSRSNLALLEAAIHYLVREKQIKNLYFEGRMETYLFSDSGTSLLDILSLYLQNNDRIRDPLVQSMRDFGELVNYIEDTQDRELKIMAETVSTYGRELPGLLKALRMAQTTTKEEAGMIFSTVHRSKGMEYGEVELCEDFIREETLQKVHEDPLPQPESRLLALQEEVNVLYVGATRTQSHLYVPEELVPSGVRAKSNRTAVVS